jgi:hypothetical protein
MAKVNLRQKFFAFPKKIKRLHCKFIEVFIIAERSTVGFSAAAYFIKI